MPAILTLLTIK